jgi:arabinogalactan endo-1,4-beta-galactosidase
MNLHVNGGKPTGFPVKTDRGQFTRPARQAGLANRLARRIFLKKAVGGAMAIAAAGDSLLLPGQAIAAADGIEIPKQATKRPEFQVGVDANFAWEMTAGQLDRPLWSDAGKPVQLFPFLRSIGVQQLRIRLWTVEKGAGSLEAATALAKAGAAAGLSPLVVFFLSDDFSDFGKAPLAARWKGTTISERGQAIARHAEAATRHFKAAGVTVPVYAIGNESDFGLAGLFGSEFMNQFTTLVAGGFPIFGEPQKPASEKARGLLDRLQHEFWPQEAELAAACARGIRAADPQAKLLMHVAQSREIVFCHAFFDTMRRYGVPLDYAGLSYYPAILGDRDDTLTRRTITHLADSLKLPTLLCEVAYPSQRPTGPFAFMRNPMTHFPFTPEGQKDWLLDLWKWTSQDPNVAAAIYWSPEWFRSYGLWDAFAWFDAEGRAKPAIEACREFQAWRKKAAGR